MSDALVSVNNAKRMRVPLLPNDTCRELLSREEALGAEFELFDSFLCGGGLQGHGPCLVSQICYSLRYI